jgi:hypothetical protein
MRKPLFSYAGAFAAGVVAAQFAFVTVAGQTPAPTRPAAPAARAGAAKPYSPPRTPDGKVDLQGTYDISTITPFEREAGAAETISESVAATREKETLARRARGNRPSNPDRQAPVVGGNVGGYNGFWLDPGDTWITINGERRASIVVDPPDGRVPTLRGGAGGARGAAGRGAAARGRGAAPAAPALPTSDGGEQAAPTGRGAYDNMEQRPLGERCILGFGSTSGPPSLPNGFYNNTKQIVQTPEYLMILNEMVHDARIVRIGGQHLPSNIRKWMGDSIGWWEGDTLVVETTNFTNKTRYRGASQNLKVTERFSRLDDRHLLYRFTVEDPTVFSRPWSGEVPWRPANGLLYEYACHEGNYALGNIMRGARLLENEAEAARKK